MYVSYNINMRVLASYLYESEMPLNISASTKVGINFKEVIFNKHFLDNLCSIELATSLSHSSAYRQNTVSLNNNTHMIFKIHATAYKIVLVKRFHIKLIHTTT